MTLQSTVDVIRKQRLEREREQRLERESRRAVDHRSTVAVEDMLDGDLDALIHELEIESWEELDRVCRHRTDESPSSDWGLWDLDGLDEDDLFVDDDDLDMPDDDDFEVQDHEFELKQK